MKIYLDGKFVEKEDAKISIFDHGLLYGDGVFEGIRAYNGRIFRLEKHLERLFNSAKAISLDIPMTIKEIEKAIIETCKVNNIKDGYIRIVLTRGLGDLGLDPRKCGKPTIFIIADKINLYPEEFYTKGLTLITASTRRNIVEALSPCIKSLNYLNNIMAKIEANRAGVPEAIMLNHMGYVAECTGDNIFVLRGNELITPPTWVGALEGITRDAVIEIAAEKLKISVKEEIFTTYNIYTADECFLTGTAAEIVPVIKVDLRPIGKGVPGQITGKLIKEFKKLTSETGTPIYGK
ncbi:MAG: branched-chain-amino-acid transaminase [Elusimicrobia bacterium]|nr:branched-chain-amino-acid transaminase [Elusimicrobiota bacterium]